MTKPGKKKYSLASKPLSSLTIEQDYREELGDIAELAESIKEKGVLQPITINPDGRILAGRRRFLASKEAGLDEIPVLVKETEDELDEREIELFENIHRKDLTWKEQARLTARIHELMVEESGENWNQRKTAKLLGKAQSTVNDAIQLSQAIDIIPGVAEAKTADAARKKVKRIVEDAVVAEALQEAKTKNQQRSIVWANDHYRVGDALEGMTSAEDECANFAEVDPPYGIALDKYHKETGRNVANAESYNEIDKKDYPKFIETAAKQVYRLLDGNSFCIWWYGPTWHQTVLDTLRSVGFHVDDIPAIWYKKDSASPTANPQVYLNRGYEPFFVCRKGSPTMRKRGRSNVFEYPSPRGDRIHPTERPLDMMTDLLDTFVYPSARILVPFVGSGNTLLAAYKCGMTAWGWDLSGQYKPTFLKRVAEAFPEEASE